MKNLRFLMLLLALITFSTSCSNSKMLIGNWKGTGNQIDGNKWQVDLKYSDKENISIDYPDLSCGGFWSILKEDKKVIVFKEKIEYGVLYCDQGVEVIVNKIDKNTIQLNFYLRSYDPIKPIADATLYRSIKN